MKIILNIAVFLAIALFIVYKWKEFEVIKTINFMYLPLIMLTIFLQLFVAGRIFSILVKTLGVDLKFSEWFGLTIVTQFANYFLPLSLGTSAKAIYLKKKRGFSLTNFATIFAGSTVIFLLSIGIFGILVVLFFIIFRHDLYDVLFLWLIILTLVFSSIFFFIPKIRIHQKNRITRILNNIQEGWFKIRKRKKVISRIVYWNLVAFIIMSVNLYVLYRSIGIHVSVLYLFLFSLTSSLLQFIMLTPNNLGFQEALIGYLSKLGSIGFYEGVSIMIIGRICHIVMIFCLAPIYNNILLSRK